jgi:hypothetical protein
MKIALISSLTALLAIAATDSSAQAKEALFKSDGMRGVTTSLLGIEIRNVPGAGAPWVLDKGVVRIDDLGMDSVVRLRLRVAGLVLDPAAVASPPTGPGGTNPIPNFGVVISCIDGVDGAGVPTFTNVTTDLFPADESGNAKLDTNIVLPTPCVGIIVFVTSPGGSWFAATGF